MFLVTCIIVFISKWIRKKVFHYYVNNIFFLNKQPFEALFFFFFLTNHILNSLYDSDITKLSVKKTRDTRQINQCHVIQQEKHCQVYKNLLFEWRLISYSISISTHVPIIFNQHATLIPFSYSETKNDYRPI